MSKKIGDAFWHHPDNQSISGVHIDGEFLGTGEHFVAPRSEESFDKNANQTYFANVSAQLKQL